jgi:hypothetical protein
MIRRTYLLIALVLPMVCGAAVQNSNSVSPGEFLIDPPTLINLGFEWFIEGEANHNASVDVSYRRKGDSQIEDGIARNRSWDSAAECDRWLCRPRSRHGCG